MTSTRLPVLVFDGDCQFCTRAAGWSRAIAPAEVSIAASRDVDLQAVGLTRQQCTEALQFVGSDGFVRSGAGAVAGLLRGCGGGWAVAGRAMDLPGVSTIAGVCYRVVSRHRHRLPGGTAECRTTSHP